MDVQPVRLQHANRQRRTLLLANGWQLGIVANEQHTAVSTAIDELYQVVQQLTVGKGRVAVFGGVGHHRCLVDDEQRVLCRVVVQVECAFERLLAVDAAVDGIGGVPGIERENGGRQRCLTRTCRPSHHHSGLPMTVGHEQTEHLDGLFLFCGRHMSEGTSDAIFHLVGNHAALLFQL